MTNKKILLFGDTTLCDIQFLLSSSHSLSSTLSSTRSDAQSAPPELERLFERICNAYTEWVVRAGKHLPPEWNMPDLVRAVMGDEAIHSPGFLTSAYYDVMLHGPLSWGCQDVFQFVDLINYNL